MSTCWKYWKSGQYSDVLYIGNTFVDPTHCDFRYTKIIYNKEKIAYHVWEAGYLADQANIKRTNHQKKEVSECLQYSYIFIVYCSGFKLTYLAS